VAISERQLDVLFLLVARAGQIVTKDDLLQAGWQDVAVGDNSLEQAISSLRRLLGAHPSGVAYIETVPRRGYRFQVEVARRTTRESDAGLEALLAPHRAFIEGRAALETLDREQIARARDVFEGALQSLPEHASAHVGLANACVMQFEMTRADPAPDTDALARAAHHAREACRLDPESGEAWATLGFVLDRTGDGLDALAASKRAVTLEPDNWQHRVRLAYVSWGEERLRAAQRTLALLPHFPPAHWLAATVHVARQAFPEAERELMTALASQAGAAKGQPRFSSVALHWLLGLLHLARGDEIRALEEFELELSLEDTGHLYSRECCANTWYALGALRLRQGHQAEAGTAFQRALERVAGHPMARVGLAAVGPPSSPSVRPQDRHRVDRPDLDARAVEAALVRAGRLVVAGAHADAAHVVGEALTVAAAGDAGWVLPVEPLLHVTAHLDTWARPLALIRDRAA
jgi:DNA-binding winged helix-turn-helix (wHTH) protein/Flp pilus assembly protein TadD